jgi:hypothetical protein
MINHPKRRTDVHAESMPDGSMLLFDPVSMMGYPISASAGAIWQACDGAHSLEQIVNDLNSVYDASCNQIECDTIAFLEHLAQIGLLDAF